jgi:hypothetical protein
MRNGSNKMDGQQIDKRCIESKKSRQASKANVQTGWKSTTEKTMKEKKKERLKVQLGRDCR